MFDPNKYSTETEKKQVSYADKPKKITAGKKILAPVGAAFKVKNNKKVLEVCHVCIKDLEKKGEEGVIYVDEFYYVEKAFFKLANFVLALGFRDLFDHENMDDIEKVLLTGPFQGVFTNNTYKKKVYTNLTYYNPVEIERAEDGEPCFNEKELEIIRNGERSWDNILKYRMEAGTYGDYEADEQQDDEDEMPF